MVRVTLWPQLLLVTLILRQSPAVSDQCSELQEEISRLERDVVSITELKQDKELLASNCHEKLTSQILISQATSKELNKTVAVNNVLKKQLEVKDEVLKSINEKQTQLHTTINDLTNSIDSINQAVQNLRKEFLKSINEKQTELHTTIDDLTKKVDLLNDLSQLLCELPKNVCRSLLEAAKSGDVNRTKILYRCSNDNCTGDDRFHDTPLTYAARYGSVDVVRVLLEGGANVDRATVIGSTALHVAAQYGHVDVCRLLLDWGAKVDHLDNRTRYTALHNAAWEGHLSVVKLLVERGADVGVKNDWGQTASDLARKRGKKDVADWLDSVSAQPVTDAGRPWRQ